MKKQLREKVRQKYNGKCAYTGKTLGDDWQVDHMRSKFIHNYFYDGCSDLDDYRASVERLENLMPTLRIVNHYKRSKDLEEFRDYMMNFHIRLSRVPKEPYTEKGKKRKAYMMEVAEAFGIKKDKPFTGKFYFETI